MKVCPPPAAVVVSCRFLVVLVEETGSWLFLGLQKKIGWIHRIRGVRGAPKEQMGGGCLKVSVGRCVEISTLTGWGWLSVAHAAQGFPFQVDHLEKL